MSNKLEELSDEEIANDIMQKMGIIPKEQVKPRMPSVLSFLGKQGTGGVPAATQPQPAQQTQYPFLSKRAQELKQGV